MQRVLDQGYATTAQVTGAQYQRKMPIAADGWRPRFVEQELSVDLRWQGKDGKPHEHRKVPISENLGAGHRERRAGTAGDPSGEGARRGDRRSGDHGRCSGPPRVAAILAGGGRLRRPGLVGGFCGAHPASGPGPGRPITAMARSALRYRHAAP